MVAVKTSSTLTNQEILALLIFISYFLSYVISNAGLANEPPSSPLKHFIMAVAAMLSFTFKPVNTFKCILILLPLALIYYWGGLPMYCLMVLVLAASLPFLGLAINAAIEKQKKLILLMGFISILPFVITFYSSDLDLILSMAYGRPRLLMGYWHPKEAAIGFGVPMLLGLIAYRDRIPKFLYILGPLFLWLVGSRNMAIALVLIYFFKHYKNLTVIFTLIILLGLLSFLEVDTKLYDFLNVTSSLRLDVWRAALGHDSNIVDSPLIGGARLSIDSFYVEMFSISGWIGFFLFSSWALFFYIKYLRPLPQSSWNTAVFFGLLFVSIFDSGIASTGNLFHVVAWVLIFRNIFNAKSTQRIFS